MKKSHRYVMVAMVGFSAIIANAQLTYTTGLDVWLDASDIDGSGSDNSSLTNGEAISSWFNKGTTGASDATRVGGASTYNATGGVLQAAVTLDDSRYQTDEYADSTNRTIYFVVYRADTSGAAGTLLNDYGGTGGELLMVRTGGEGTGQRDANNEATWLTSPVDVNDQWVTVFYSFNAADGTIRFGEVGGVIETGTMPEEYDLNTSFEGSQHGLPTLFGFHDGNASHDFNGRVSEVLIFDHLLDAAARNTVESYLAAKASDPEPIEIGTIVIEGPVPASGSEGMVISWMGGLNGQLYDVQSKSDLTAVEWVTFTNVVGVEETMMYVTNNIDTDAAFYRVVTP